MVQWNKNVFNAFFTTQLQVRFTKSLPNPVVPGFLLLLLLLQQSGHSSPYFTPQHVGYIGVLASVVAREEDIGYRI